MHQWASLLTHGINHHMSASCKFGYPYSSPYTTLILKKNQVLQFTLYEICILYTTKTTTTSFAREELNPLNDVYLSPEHPITELLCLMIEKSWLSLHYIDRNCSDIPGLENILLPGPM